MGRAQAGLTIRRYTLCRRSTDPLSIMPAILNIIATIAPAFPLPDPNTAPAVVLKCTTLKITASKPSVRAVFAPFIEERFLARTAKTMLNIPKSNSASPMARAGVMPLT